jgi:membrane protein YdbS with pleckstrin-like domain
MDQTMADDSQGTPGNDNPSLADSTKDTPRDMLKKLRDMPLFAAYTDEQFRAVSDLLRIEKVERTTLLIQQGGMYTNMYLLRHGQAVVRMVDADGKNHFVKNLTVGEIFNEAAFLTGLRSARTVEALTPLTLWCISRESFLALLAERPELMPMLNPPADLPVRLNTPAAKRRQRQQVFQWQRSNEHMAHYCHKHPWVFWRRLWPLLFAAAAILVLVLVARNYDGSAQQAGQAAAPSAVTGPAQVFTIETPLLLMLQALVILVALASFLYVIYQIIDWQNDYYAVTDQRLIHRERTVLIRDQQSEVPMNKVQNVSIDRPGIMSWLLDYGNLTIDASGLRSKVQFNDIAKPDQVAEIILNQSQRMHGDSLASQRVKMRADLINELHIVPSNEEDKQAAHKRPAQRKLTLRSRSSLDNVRNTFMPHMRVVEGDTILYHKHWLQLAEELTFPVSAVLVYVALLILMRLFVPSVAQIVLGTPLEIGVIVVGIGLLLWVMYRYENWRNDIYILTPDRIVDIDRSPFGVGPSSRREARLLAVQNVNLDMSGLWDNAFNIGNVIIQTAGAEGTLTFERVHDPHGVQRDIMSRMEAQDARVRERQMAERRHEFAEWVGIYDELKKMYGDNSKQP